MDIVCHICLEPIDIAEFHYMDWSYDESMRRFRRDGCEGIGYSHSAYRNPGAGLIVSELSDLLGDDVDGLASLLDDFGPAIYGEDF